MFTVTIASVDVIDGEYTLTTTDGDGSVWTRNASIQIANLPSWNEMLADLIDQQGSALIGKTITVDTSNANLVAVI